MQELTLVDQGDATFTVRIDPPQDAEAIFEAIAELQIHLEACLGKPVPWFERRATPSPVQVVLSFAPAAELAMEAFDCIITSQDVTLRAATPTGMQHAVHYFLETAFGVRWLWPGSLGAVTPVAETVTLPLGQTVHQPDWDWRRLWLGGAFWEEDDPTLAELKQAGVSPETLRGLRQWQARNRLGGLDIADGHRWGQICSPLVYGETHPEYFALVDGQRDTVYRDGKHGNQPCTSNPEVIALTAAHIIAQFERRPELDGFSFSVNDGKGFCECADCQALDETVNCSADDDFAATTAEHLQTPGRSTDYPITDRMLRFANAVAERVAAHCPRKRLLFLIYGPYRQPPLATKLHPNVIAQFCSRTWANQNDSIRRREMAVAEQLCSTAECLGIYDYFVNGRNGTVPRGFGRILEQTLKAYHQLGYRYFATQAGLDFAANGFVYYLAARLLWDTQQDTETILEDYCRCGFGGAAGCIQDYLTAFMDRWEEIEIESERAEDLALQLYPPAWRADRRQQLGQALVACRTDPVAARRVDFLREGLDFLDLYCDAAEAVVAVHKAGCPVDREGIESWLASDPDSVKIEEAIDRRRALMEWIAGHQDGFWMSSLWFRYQAWKRDKLMGLMMDNLEAVMGGDR